MKRIDNFEQLLRESIKLMEDFFDDLDASENRTNAVRGYKPIMKADKNMLGRSKRSVQAAAKEWEMRQKDGTYSGNMHNDYSSYVRNYFTNFISLGSARDISGLTVRMRNILGIEKTEATNFEWKWQKRGPSPELKNGLDNKRYSEIDIITLAELTAIYMIKSVGIKNLEKSDKIRICEFAAKATRARKFGDVEDIEQHSEDILRDLERLGYSPTIKVSLDEEPFTPFNDPNWENNYNEALGWTSAEISADSHERNKAAIKHKNRKDAHLADVERKRKIHSRQLNKYKDAIRPKFKGAGIRLAVEKAKKSYKGYFEGY